MMNQQIIISNVCEQLADISASTQNKSAQRKIQDILQALHTFQLRNIDYKSAIDHLTDGILISDATGMVLYINNAFAQSTHILPEEILHHTYEYTVREDIVMAMEELELTDAQAQALLESPSPLADVYRYFEKLETGYMDVIRDSIENRADDVCRAKEELRTTPIYPHSAAYAREHGELEQYRASNNVNRQCKESIEAAVREHFDGMYLSHDAAKGVIETYGMERVSMVLSNTVQLQDWDGRYSRRNKEWAKTIPNDNPETVRCGYALNSHPAVLDGFIDLVREEQQRSRTQREKLEPSRPSVRDKLKQELPAHKSAAPKKREPER